MEKYEIPGKTLRMLSDILLDQEWNPFVGPRPFKREEREYESEKIISLIYCHRVVLLYAQSGAGKTSIFNASITPMLEERGLQVLPQVRIRVQCKWNKPLHL